ncbi:hypothetical protein IQ270_26410 [Microcoleus sp. LEGE 07076]|uniref:hypothetical protein n=1 Tax=Microcoleus sp. LEGE 07076 TaxID=915322 RepID=UPI00187DDCF0|nr:hypothetical protein [Microcoleus sp. LEGE 07076]MBE9188075.1 hypothetical protein [Microcoleus sp. LEGE 07076]
MRIEEMCLDRTSQFLLTSSKDSEPKGLGIQPLIFLRFPKSGCECTIAIKSYDRL